MTNNDMLSVEEAAQLTGYSRGHVARLCREGKLLGATKVAQGKRQPYLIPASSFAHLRPARRRCARLARRAVAQGQAQ